MGAQWDAASLTTSSYLSTSPLESKYRERNGQGRAPQGGSRVSLRCCESEASPQPHRIQNCRGETLSQLHDESLGVPRHTSLRTTSQAVRRSKLRVMNCLRQDNDPYPVLPGKHRPTVTSSPGPGSWESGHARPPTPSYAHTSDFCGASLTFNLRSACSAPQGPPPPCLTFLWRTTRPLPINMMCGWPHPAPCSSTRPVPRHAMGWGACLTLRSVGGLLLGAFVEM